MEQNCEPMNKNRIRGASAGRVAQMTRSPYPSRARGVNSAAVQGRRAILPQEICIVSLEVEGQNGLGEPGGEPIAMQKSAEGIVGVGSRTTRAGHSLERGETAGLAGAGTPQMKARTDGGVGRGRELW